jgi:phytoene synthase
VRFDYDRGVGIKGDVTDVTTDGADPAAFAAARDDCLRHARGFYLASTFLQRAKRDAACAVVAFCRMVREAMDVPGEALEGAAGLRHHPLGAVRVGEAAQGACTTCGPSDSRIALLRERLDEIYDGRQELPRPESRSAPQHTLHAFALAARRFEIPKQLCVDLALGLRADHAVARYATWASLERHCRGYAGPVALMLTGVFGVTHSGAGEHAMALATAMRLTAILRDVKRDRDRGKVYLPLEDMARFRYGERDLARGVVNERFRELMRFEIARARHLYRAGADGLCWLADDRARLTVSALAAASAGTLDAIERHGCDVFARRPELTAAQKLRRLPVAWTLSRRRPGERLPDVFRAGR